MSKYIKELNTIMNDPSFGEFQDQQMHETGFEVLDFLNGNKEVTTGDKPIYNIGMDAGKIITVIGKPGTGKSTLAVQMAYNIVKKHESGAVFILDYEQAHTYNRVKAINNLTDEEVRRRFNIRHTGISTETVLELAIQIKDAKLKHKDELMMDVDNGKIDPETGKVAQVMAPTVIIVDSAAIMRPREDMLKEEMQGQMDATQAAKANKQLMIRLAQPTREANIIVIMINHIQQRVQTGFFPTKGDLQYLKQDEMISGGIAIQHMSNTLLKLEAGTKLTEDKKYQIKGSEIKVELIKSRTAASGLHTTMIFDQANGFDNDLSTLNFLASEKLIGGSPHGYYVETDELRDVKFRNANFKEVINGDPEYKKKFYEYAREVLASKLPESFIPANDIELVDEDLEEAEE